MTATYDASSAINGAATTGVIVSHTCANQPNRVLIGFVVWWDDTFTPTSLSYAGSAMTYIGTVAPVNNCLIAAWYTMTPAVGANNLQSQMSGSVVHAAHCTSFYNAGRIAPVFTGDGGIGSAPNNTVSTAPNEYLVDGISTHGDENGAVGPDQAQRTYTANVGYGLQSTQPGSAGGTMSWNNSTTWAQYIARVFATGGGTRAYIIASKIQEFLGDLKQGLIPANVLKQKYEQLISI